MVMNVHFNNGTSNYLKANPRLKPWADYLKTNPFSPVFANAVRNQNVEAMLSYNFQLKKMLKMTNLYMELTPQSKSKLLNKFPKMNYSKKNTLKRKLLCNTNLSMMNNLNAKVKILSIMFTLYGLAAPTCENGVLMLPNEQVRNFCMKRKHEEVATRMTNNLDGWKNGLEVFNQCHESHWFMANPKAFSNEPNVSRNQMSKRFASIRGLIRAQVSLNQTRKPMVVWRGGSTRMFSKMTKNSIVYVAQPWGFSKDESTAMGFQKGVLIQVKTNKFFDLESTYARDPECSEEKEVILPPGMYKIIRTTKIGNLVTRLECEFTPSVTYMGTNTLFRPLKDIVDSGICSERIIVGQRVQGEYPLPNARRPMRNRSKLSK